MTPKIMKVEIYRYAFVRLILLNIFPNDLWRIFMEQTQQEIERNKDG